MNNGMKRLQCKAAICVQPRLLAGLSDASWLLFLFSIISGFVLRSVPGVTF
jgi:hypothetical protein